MHGTSVGDHKPVSAAPIRRWMVQVAETTPVRDVTKYLLDPALQRRVVGAKKNGDQSGWPYALRENLGQQVQRPGRVVPAVPSQHDICLSQCTEQLRLRTLLAGIMLRWLPRSNRHCNADYLLVNLRSRAVSTCCQQPGPS